MWHHSFQYCCQTCSDFSHVMTVRSKPTWSLWTAHSAAQQSRWRPKHDFVLLMIRMTFCYIDCKAQETDWLDRNSENENDWMCRMASGCTLTIMKQTRNETVTCLFTICYPCSVRDSKMPFQHLYGFFCACKALLYFRNPLGNPTTIRIAIGAFQVQDAPIEK